MSYCLMSSVAIYSLAPDFCMVHDLTGTQLLIVGALGIVVVTHSGRVSHA